MGHTPALVWMALLLQVVLGASMSNLRAKDVGSPDYMKLAGGVKSKQAKRSDLGEEKGHMLADVYTECTVPYNESKTIANNVWAKADLKIADSEGNAAALEKKIATATEGDNVKDPATGESQKMKWMDHRDNEKAEAVFFGQIISNAKQVLEMADRGLKQTVALRKKVNAEFDDLDNVKLPVTVQTDDASEVLAEAKRLWKQWEDSTRDYNCAIPVPVQNAQSQCKTGNTKFGIRCLITCIPGYDDPTDSKNLLRCRKEGKFGRELYGEWKRFSSCVGRMCGMPAEIEKAKTAIQKIRFPHAATYNCFEGYSQDGNARGPKAFAVACGKTGFFEQNSSHLCQRVKCGAAPAEKNTEAINGTFYFSDTVNYKCNKGHTLDATPGGLQGFPTTCQATGRFSQGQTCRRVRCGPSPDYDATTATRMTIQGEKYYGDLTDYKCHDGYTTDQKASGPKKFTLKCTETGEFALKGSGGNVPIPQCRAVSAGILPEVAHGSAKRREMFYGESVVVTAETGYSSTGRPTEGLSFTVSVTTQGTFAGLETLLPVNCGAPPAVEKATSSFASKEGVYGNVLDYACADGYSTDMSDTDEAKIFSLQCESDADYTRVPNIGKCVNIDDCADHSCGPHGDCIDHLKNYTCRCDSGYEQTWNKDTSELVCGNIDDCGAEACGVGTCEDLVNGYKCHCPTGYEEVGEAEEKTCKKKTCGLPPAVDHSTTVPAIAGQQKAVYQEKVVYQCDTGYTLDGSAVGKNHFEIDCKASTSFTATKSCKPIKCGNGPKVDHASKQPNQATFNESIRYTCADGYTIDGTPRGDSGFSLTCLVTGEYSDVAKCRPVNCGEPDEIPSASRPDGSLVYTKSANYKCFKGFTLNGKKDGPTEFNIECHADGSLDPLKTCLPKVCGTPVRQINALHATTRDEGALAYPRNTEITCRDGYTVGGSAGGRTSFTVKCEDTGDFDEYDKQECEPVRCGPPPTMPNATLTKVWSPHSPPDKQHLNFEEKAFYKCLPGFSTGGEVNAPTVFKAECLPSGQLSAPAADMQCRNINDCERHTCGPKGTCIDLIGPSPAYTCKCEFGFEIQTKANGEKTCGNTDDCKDQDCGTGICKDLVGDYTCICPVGYFIGKKDGKKSCMPVQCEDTTPSLEHGQQTTAHSGAVIFPTTLQYKCDQGYSIDGSVADSKRRFQAQCKPNGQLDGMVSCQKITCGTAVVLPFTNLLSPASPRRSIEYGEKVKYKCAEGYTIGGNVQGATEFTTNCPDDGILTDPEVCEPVFCGKAPRVPKSRSGISGDVFYGMHLEYTCDAGYTLDGTAQGPTTSLRHCQKDGVFSALAIEQPCKPVSGGKAPTLQNAVMTEYAGRPVDQFPPDIYYPQGLEYKCKAGYSENGAPSGPTKMSARVNTLGQLTPALPSGCQMITYTIRGVVKNSRNGQSLRGATVSIQGSAAVGVINGFFTLSGVKPKDGSVTLVYQKPGFISLTKQIAVSSNIYSGGVADTSMSPKMASDQWRSVIKWNRRPSDLDTFGKWGTTHSCWYQKNRASVGMRVILEHDDVNGYGPETLFFKRVGKCTASKLSGLCDIRYMINDYNDGGKMKDISGAQVTLYHGDGVAGTFSIKGCQGSVSRDGNWWHVFTIDGKTNQLKWTCNQGQPESAYTPGGANWGFLLHHRKHAEAHAMANRTSLPLHKAISPVQAGGVSNNSSSHQVGLQHQKKGASLKSRASVLLQERHAVRSHLRSWVKAPP